VAFIHIFHKTNHFAIKYKIHNHIDKTVITLIKNFGGANYAKLWQALSMFYFYTVLCKREVALFSGVATHFALPINKINRFTAAYDCAGFPLQNSSAQLYTKLKFGLVAIF
jgi:hypothetical protein